MRIWQLIPEVATKVRLKHETVGLHGHHDFVHAFRVGEIARQIALDEWSDNRLSTLAGLAGLCHNADRIVQKELDVGTQRVSDESVTALVTAWLQESLNEGDVAAVVEAVLKHNEKNSVEDSQILIALMDGDRVVNLDTDLFPRSGQLYHNLPVVDYRHLLDDPAATYQNPKSVLRDIGFALEWVNPSSDFCVRTHLGQKMAKDRVVVFRTFFDSLKTQLTEEGVYPFTL